MPNKTTTLPHGTADLDTDDLKWLLLWERYRKSAVVSIVVLAVVAIVGGIYIYSRSVAATEAATALSKATDVAAWNRIVEQYPQSIPAGDALFLLARAQRDEGNLKESSATYQKILDAYPKHPLVAEASLGLASNLAKEGKVDEAVQAYQQTSAVYGASFVAPIALFSQAHLLLAQGKQNEALPILEVILSQYPDSLVSFAAESLVEQVRPLVSAP